MTLWVKNFGFSSASIPVLDFTDSDTSSADQSTYTFTNRAIGPANNNRLVVVVTQAGNNGSRVSSVQIGGVAATELVDVATNGPCAIYARVVPTGTTATIAITYNASQNGCLFQVYTITGLSSTTPVSTYSATNNDPSTTINVPAGGIVIAGAHSDANTTATWTGADEDFDGTVSTPTTGTSASKQYLVAQSSLNLECNFGSNTSPSLVAAVFR